MRTAQDETLIIDYNEKLTGHQTHLPASHRMPAEFSVFKNTIGWFVALTILAGLLTGAITQSQAAQHAQPAAKPLAAILAPGHPWSLYSAPTGHVGPPLKAQEPGPDPSFQLTVLIKPRPVIAPVPVPIAGQSHVTVVPAVAGGNGKIQIVIGYALAQLGKPYRWGAAGPNAFDCSGLVLAAYAQIGIKMYHFTGAMLGYGHRVSRGDMQPGDLIFPSDHHVGIYLGGNRAVFAPHPGAVVQIQTVYSFYAAVRIL
jgi:cell wall-associated NlpC family hydrolase